MKLQKDQWGSPRSLDNVQSGGQKQRLELFLPLCTHMDEGKASAEVFWAPGQREGGALSNRDLLYASEEASRGPATLSVIPFRLLGSKPHNNGSFDRKEELGKKRNFVPRTL